MIRAITLAAVLLQVVWNKSVLVRQRWTGTWASESVVVFKFVDGMYQVDGVRTSSEDEDAEYFTTTGPVLPPRFAWNIELRSHNVVINLRSTGREKLSLDGINFWLTEEPMYDRCEELYKESLVRVDLLTRNALLLRSDTDCFNVVSGPKDDLNHVASLKVQRDIRGNNTKRFHAALELQDANHTIVRGPLWIQQISPSDLSAQTVRAGSRFAVGRSYFKTASDLLPAQACLRYL